MESEIYLAYYIVRRSAARGERDDHSVPFAVSGGFPSSCIAETDPERHFEFLRRSLTALYRVPFCDAVLILARWHHVMRTIPITNYGLETGDMVVPGMSKNTGFEPIR
jgi:hypothetical protein